MSHRGKTIMYFDNSNIFKGQLDLGWRIDVDKFIKKIESGQNIWQTYFFAAVTDPPRFSQTGFYKMLKEKFHWETILFPLGSKTTFCKNCHEKKRISVEKGVDVAIATTMLKHAITRSFETAILVSGDKDYLDTVKAIKSMGLRVEIVSFRHTLSQELAHESSASPLILDSIKPEIELLMKYDADELLTSDDVN